MTALTLFDLVIRSMRKNIKHYYLYFFALILSVVLYFVFATLQYDSAVVEQSATSMNMAAAFSVAGILLLFIAGIFVVYANAIFLKRRSREIGLYQLIGLTKGAVARLLIIENALLGAGALVIGIGAGMLVSRVFLLLLMKLVGYDGFIALSFSMAAVIQTAVVFIAIIALDIYPNAVYRLPQHVAWVYSMLIRKVSIRKSLKRSYPRRWPSSGTRTDCVRLLVIRAYDERMDVIQYDSRIGFDDPWDISRVPRYN